MQINRVFPALFVLALTLLVGCGGDFKQAHTESAPPMDAAPAVDVGSSSAGVTTKEEVYRDEVVVAGKAPGGVQESLFHPGADFSKNIPAAAPPPPPPPPPAARSFQAQAGQPAPGPTTPPQAQPTAKKPAEPAQVATGDAAALRTTMLIYTAEITMAVFEVNKQLSAVETLAKDEGGFLARRDDASITIRVPVARFEAVVQKIEKLGDMLHRNVVAQDVTEEFRDLEVQLRSARAVRDRLEQLLSKAVKVEESIAIERELDRVSGEIDRIEGRMKFLKDRAAYSTITVTFSAKSKENVNASHVRLPANWLDSLGLQRLLSL